VSTNERRNIIEELIVNTTSGPRVIPEGVRKDVHPDHTINTSRILEEDMQSLDEGSEIISVLPGTGWAARFDDGHVEPLVAFVAWDDASMTGVVVGDDGRIDLENSVENRPDFSGCVNDNDRS
jgi:hypothetical protein